MLRRLKNKIKSSFVLIVRLCYVILFFFLKTKVIIAPVYSSGGGVTNHIKMIHKNTKIKTHIYLPNLVLRILKIINIKPASFYNISKLRTKIIHSHVDNQTIEQSFEAQKKGVKWINTYHSFYFEDQWEGGLQKWQKDINSTLINVAKNADIKISVSKWLQNFFKEDYSIETVYIPNGVNVDECNKANANHFIDKFGLSDFILFSGNLSDVKDPIMFVKLAQNNPDFLFVMTGSDLIKENIENKYKIDLPVNIKPLGGLSRKDAINAVAACKIMVSTSKSEGLPTAIMEAMILQRTIVAPNSYGCQEVLNYGECGYLYEPYNLQSLNEMFHKALADKDIVIKAKQYAEENYDWKKIIPQIDEQYLKLLN